MVGVTQATGKIKIALVHDYLNQLGGAERVFEVFCEMFPEAPIFTLFYDEKGTRGRFRGRAIRQAFPLNLPTRFFFWAYPRLIESFNFSGFDLVISSSWSYGKGIKVPRGIPHICYCYTPTRYLWEDVRQYVRGFLASSVATFVGEFFFKSVREWDKQAALRPTALIAISNHIAGRIRQVYGREPDAVIPASVELAKFRNSDMSRSREYFLMVGRLLPYKKFDLAIDACNRLRLPLKIVGEGRDISRLQKIAGPTVEFLGWVSDEKLPAVYAGARALLFPQVEDFGLVAVEAIASGTPVIAYKSGGVLDIVQAGVNGVFFGEQTPESLMATLQKVDSMHFDPLQLAESVKKFDKTVFQKALIDIIERTMEEM
ncbi:MAG: glycosyltransferase [Parcubacteria group bacterium]|nr:glycosyltransferase [Parcubacteria group bacterium]